MQRILVVSAWSDENQHHDQLKSLAIQDGVAITHRIIQGLSALDGDSRTLKFDSKALLKVIHAVNVTKVACRSDN